jgi:hypothetical protein
MPSPRETQHSSDARFGTRLRTSVPVGPARSRFVPCASAGGATRRRSFPSGKQESHPHRPKCCERALSTGVAMAGVPKRAGTSGRERDAPLPLRRTERSPAVQARALRAAHELELRRHDRGRARPPARTVRSSRLSFDRRENGHASGSEFSGCRPVPPRSSAPAPTAPPRGRPALAIPYSVLITLASAKSSCVRPPAACVESVIRSRL